MSALRDRVFNDMHLQASDVDSTRMMVHVHRGKGAGHRYVPLPQSALCLLRRCWATRRNPVWLFPALGRDRKQGATADRPMPRQPSKRKRASPAGWLPQVVAPP